MLKKSREELATEILEMAQSIQIEPPTQYQSLDDYFRQLNCNIENWMHCVAMTIVNNIYTEQEMSDKIDGILLDDDKKKSN